MTVKNTNIVIVGGARGISATATAALDAGSRLTNIGHSQALLDAT